MRSLYSLWPRAAGTLTSASGHPLIRNGITDPHASTTVPRCSARTYLLDNCGFICVCMVTLLFYICHVGEYLNTRATAKQLAQQASSQAPALYLDFARWRVVPFWRGQRLLKLRKTRLPGRRSLGPLKRCRALQTPQASVITIVPGI